MIECCGKVIKTAYCPHCGKKMSGKGSLCDLLRHIQKQLHINNDLLQRIYEGISEPDKDEEKSLNDERFIGNGE